MRQWQGARVAPSSDSQAWTGLLLPHYFHSQYHLGHPSASRTFVSSAELQPPQSDFCSICDSHRTWGQRDSPFPSKYYSFCILAPGSRGMWGPTEVEGTGTCLGAEVPALQQLLPREDISNSTKWSLPQICVARVLGCAVVAAAAPLGELGCPS